MHVIKYINKMLKLVQRIENFQIYILIDIVEQFINNPEKSRNIYVDRIKNKIPQ